MSHRVESLEAVEHRKSEEKVLHKAGQQALFDLFGLLQDQHLTEINPEVIPLLKESFFSYPPSLFNQLGFLAEEPVFRSQEQQKGHWFYEKCMAQKALEFSPQIKEWFGEDDAFIADLVFMIIVGDIGKAGPVEVADHEPEAVVRRIYNQAVFHKKHKQWLIGKTPADFPPEIRGQLELLSKETATSGSLSPYETVFSRGEFFALPLEAYLHVIQQVSLEEADGDLELQEKAQKLFSLTPEEREYLVTSGRDPQTTPMRRFFTTSHITFGDMYLKQQGLLNEHQLSLVDQALAHHFSQGMVPQGLDVRNVLEEKWVKVTAFLEILDKVQAGYSRWQGSHAGEVLEKNRSLIETGLAQNYPGMKTLLQWYGETFDWMVQSGILASAEVTQK